jgi:hypothetical protein
MDDLLSSSVQDTDDYPVRQTHKAQTTFQHVGVAYDKLIEHLMSYRSDVSYIIPRSIAFVFHFRFFSFAIQVTYKRA